MKRILVSFLADDGGVTAIDYGLLAALVSVASLVAYRFLADAVDGIFQHIITSFIAAST